MCQFVSSATQDFEGALVHLQNVQSVHLREYCNVYKLQYAIYRMLTRP